MKGAALFMLIILSFPNNLVAQDTLVKNSIYRTWIYLNREPFEMTGFLYQVNDSSISISESSPLKEYSAGKFEITQLYIPDIETITLRKNNKKLNAALIGAVSGFVVGGIIGLASGDDPEHYWIRATAEEKAVLFGSILAGGGFGIGTVVGSIKVKIPIHGKMDNFNRNKNKLI